MRGNTKQVSLCGIFSAFSLVVMFLGTVVDIFDLTAAVIASFVVFIVSTAYGYKWGLCQYLLVALLSAIFLGGKFVFLVYVTVGYYPLLKSFFDNKLNNKILKLFLKLIVFNIGFTVLLFFGKSVLFTLDSSGNMIVWELILAYPVANVFIILCDILCDKILLKYGRMIFKMFG